MNNQSLFNEPRYTNEKDQPINRKVDLSKHSALIWAYVDFQKLMGGG